MVLGGGAFFCERGTGTVYPCITPHCLTGCAAISLLEGCRSHCDLYDHSRASMQLVNLCSVSVWVLVLPGVHRREYVVAMLGSVRTETTFLSLCRAKETATLFTINAALNAGQDMQDPSDDPQ